MLFYMKCFRWESDVFSLHMNFIRWVIKTNWSFYWSVFKFIVGVSLVVIVAVENWVIDQLDLFFAFFLLDHLEFLGGYFPCAVLIGFLLSILFFPHWRRIGPFLIPHILIHESIPKAIIRLFPYNLEIFLRTSPI